MIVFVCSRYRGNTPEVTEGNVERTIAICRALVMAGHTPIAPHLYLTRFLNDEHEGERALGILLGQKAMLMCDELLYDDTRQASDGMDADLEFADANAKPTRKLSDWIDAFERMPAGQRAGIMEGLRKARIVVVVGD